MRLLLITLVGFCCTNVANADDFAPARARIFASGTQYGFKVLPKGNRGILFKLLEDGSEKVMWDKQLANIPNQVFVEQYGKHVVTIDSYADLGFKHSIVVYDENGKKLGDYELEDFLTEAEIRDRVPQSTPNRWWAREADFKFRAKGSRYKYFVITMKWGTLITVDLDTGKLVRSRTDQADENDPDK